VRVALGRYRLKGRVDDFVRIVYFDEAGTSDARTEPFLVVVAVIIRDKHWLAIERAAHDIVNRLVPEKMRQEFEFHACDLFAGNTKGFQRNARDKEIRFEILKSFLTIVRDFKLPIIYTVHDKERLPIRDWQEMTVHRELGRQLCAGYVESWLVKKTRGRDVAMLISDVVHSDNKREEKLIKRYLLRNRKWPMFATMGPVLEHVVDTIHFADSRESIGLQIADACAFFIKRHYMNESHADAEPLYQIIAGNIFARAIVDGGIRDGSKEKLEKMLERDRELRRRRRLRLIKARRQSLTGGKT
jgi:uncharacterized protein DUF3800